MDRDWRVLTLTVLAAAILTPALAVAQAPPKAEVPGAPKSEQLDTNGCAHDRATISEGGALDTKRLDGRNLSDRLAHFRRRHLPAGGGRSRDQSADPAGRLDAGDSTAG
jgi:hypothetical protein